MRFASIRNPEVSTVILNPDLQLRMSGNEKTKKQRDHNVFLINYINTSLKATRMKSLGFGTERQREGKYCDHCPLKR
jgi:hypothetical protein